MNRIKFFLLLILLICAYMPLSAQSGLNVAPFFSESYSKSPGVVILSMSGMEEEKYKIDVYKSITVSDNLPLSEKISKAISKDGTRARRKDVKYKGGELYYGIYFMGGRGSERKYLLYLNRIPLGERKTTLIYIKADMSFDAVKEMIRREN